MDAGVCNLLSGSLIFIGVGIFSYQISAPALKEPPAGKYKFSGEVMEYTPSGSGDKAVVAFNELVYFPDSARSSQSLDCLNSKGLITVTDPSVIEYGSYITGEAVLEPVDTKGNVLNEDYTKYLQSKGILLKGYAEDGKISTYGHGGSSFINFFKRIRENIEILIEKSSLNPETQSFIISIGLGDKSYLSQEEKMAFADAGISHVFAVSGMHVGLISLLITATLSFIFFNRQRRLIYLVSLPIIWLYIGITGFSAASFRAGIMITIAFSALVLERKVSSLKSLGWAVLIILAFYPRGLFDIGFQLSVICVGSLILFVTPFNFISRRQHPLLFKFVAAILVTMAATASSWVLCAYYFHSFSLIFLPANLIVVPLLPIYLFLSALYLLFYAMGFDFSFIADILNIGYSLFIDFIKTLNSFSSTIKDIHLSGLSVALWIVAVAVAGYTINHVKKGVKRLLPCPFFLASIISMLVFPGKSIPEGFIIQKNPSALTLMTYRNGLDSLYTFPSGSIATANISNKQIASIDSYASESILRSAVRNADYVILGRGTGADLYDLVDLILPELKSGSKLIIHPSIHWRREKKLKEKISSDRLYSLRHDGPLHEFLTP